MIGSGCSSGDGHTDQDDAAYARRLQDEADREHYARLIDGHGTLEAALQGGVLLAANPRKFPACLSCTEKWIL